MEYPKSFTERVKAEFPDWEAIHKNLDAGSSIVGRYLDDSRYFGMRPADIVAAFNEGRQEEVKKEAEKCVRREKLYAEWSKLYKEQVA